ncbi:hypothetical protein FOL47_010435, partial [Perkinsus chesapeaki]
MSAVYNRWDPGTHPLQPHGHDTGGLLKRWENIRHPVSSKKMISCPASTPEHVRSNYLKSTERIPDGVAYHYRALEQSRDARRESLARSSVEAALLNARECPFNILTGEGGDRDREFRGVGKAIVNPTQSMTAVFAEHYRDEVNRMRASKHRFFEPFQDAPSVGRATQLDREGFTVSQRESMIIGTVPGRHRLKSIGIDDNFGHTRARFPEYAKEAMVDKNKSQIELGYCADDGSYLGHFVFTTPSRFNFEFTLYDKLQVAPDIFYDATEHDAAGSILQLKVDTNNSDLIGILKPFHTLLNAGDFEELKYNIKDDSIYLSYRGSKDVWLTKSLCVKKALLAHPRLQIPEDVRRRGDQLESVKNNGTSASTALNMINTMVGSGMFALPYCMYLSSPVIIITLLIVVASISYLSMFVVGVVLPGFVDEDSYHAMATKLCKNTITVRFIDGTICLSLIGVIAMLLVVAYDCFAIELATTFGFVAPRSISGDHHLRQLQSNGGPLCPGSKGEQLFGYKQISRSNKYFYMTVDAEAPTAATPSFLYLPGGPGGSSVSGVLSIIGPCFLNTDNKTPLLNHNSWTKNARGIFIDAPGPVGFSEGPVPTTMSDYVNHLYEMLLSVVADKP